MQFLTTAFDGVVIIEPEARVDNRGFFARTFCVDELKAQGIHFDVAQCNLTSSARKGTLRGLHYQNHPATEQKIVYCTQGSACYVLVDLRPHSITYMRHSLFELDAASRRMLYVAPGFASGAQTLTDETQLAYMMTERYQPGREGGYRYDDPAFGISWPLTVTALSEKDGAWPPFPDGRPDSEQLLASAIKR